MHTCLPWQPRRPSARLLAVTALVNGVLVAGCGTTSRTSTVVVVGGASSTAHSAASAPNPVGSLLAMAKCMRAHGVSNFPDPSPDGHGFDVGAGIDLASPAFKAAQAKCRMLTPVLGGSAGPRFSERSLMKVRKAAVCMRAHGISQYPDPTTTRPALSALSGARVITDFDGAFLVFPSTLNMQSPAWRRAAAACGSLAQKLGTGPH
jgi:hypothetical protein